jgi:hypothetical protein
MVTWPSLSDRQAVILNVAITYFPTRRAIESQDNCMADGSPTPLSASDVTFLH